MAKYPRDEFDDLQPTGRKGAHRRGGPISQGGAIALIAVLAIAALLVVFGAFNIIRQSASNPEENVAEPPAATEEAEPTEETSDPAVDVVDKTAEVHVLNGSGVTGAAAKFREHLVSNGWNVTDVGNHATNESSSAVYYSDDEYEMQAGALAAELGVETVEKSTEFPGQVTLLITSDIADADLDSLGGDGGSTDGATGGTGN